MSSFFLHWHPYDLPLAAPWPSAAGRLGRRRGWILHLRHGPWRGFGECAPLPAAGTETFEQARAALEDLQRRLRRGEPPDALLPIPRHPAVGCGLESAWLDLESRRRGLPLSRFLSSEAANRIRVNAMAGTPCHHRLQGLLAAGFEVLKLKVGTAPWPRELACLRALCETLPPGVRLRLDANGAWSEEEAAARLQTLAGLPIELLEEPLARPSIPALARLQATTPIPLAVDESLSALGAESLFEGPAVAAVVVKPMVVGGLRPALALAHRAVAADMTPLLTSTLESALGLRTLAHLAGAWERVAPGRYHGLATAPWLARHPVPPPPIEEGWLHLDQRPGIGVTP